VKRFESIPAHIAFIMDGNGRWAREHGFSERIRGHEAGARNIPDIVEAADDAGVRFITFFMFSTENWSRPEQEVDFILSKLLKRELLAGMARMMERKVRFRVTGNIGDIPERTRGAIGSVMEATSSNLGITATLAVNYGGRQEIVDAARRMAERAREDPALLDSLDENAFRSYLYDPDIPDPDLLVRTGGEMRISNFFLWQLSYTEIYVTDKLWPDFKEEDLYEALEEFNRRQRRFGALP